MELFGFKIERTKKVPDPQQAFTPPVTDDGTTVVSAGGFFGQYLDMEGTAKSEADLIQRYREVTPGEIDERHGKPHPKKKMKYSKCLKWFVSHICAISALILTIYRTLPLRTRF